VNKQLKDAIKRSLGHFSEQHGDYPEHFIIYRDGVGDGMRRQVLQQEVVQLREAVNETYKLPKKALHHSRHCQQEDYSNIFIENQ